MGCGADELIDLYYSVIAPYRNSTSCAWIMRDATLARVRKLKGSDNNYLWQPGLQAGSPDLLLGKPVYTAPNVAAVATSAKSVHAPMVWRFGLRSFLAAAMVLRARARPSATSEMRSMA